MFAVGLLATAALGVAAVGINGSSVAYAGEEPCLGIIGETVKSEVTLLRTLLADPGAVIADEISFVLGIVNDPIGAVDGEIETVKGDLESVQACLK